MAAYKFVPNVTFENSALVTGARRNQLKVPGGVTAYEPIPLSFGEMSRKEPSKVPAPAGLTVSSIDVEAPGVTRAPKAADKAETEWTFTGGDIRLNVQISIYIIDKFAPVPQLFKVIMDHEYLHVRDDITLAQGIGKKLEADESIKRWLNGEKWTGSAFFERIQSIWGAEAKRLGNVLDTGPAYDRHKQQIARLMPR